MTRDNTNRYRTARTSYTPGELAVHTLKNGLSKASQYVSEPQEESHEELSKADQGILEAGD